MCIDNRDWNAEVFVAVIQLVSDKTRTLLKSTKFVPSPMHASFLNMSARKYNG